MSVVKFTPIVIESDEQPAEMVDLFTIDGRTYQVPAQPAAGLALLYLKQYRDHGEEIANLSLMEAVLGDEAFNALMRKGKRDHIAQVMKVVGQLTLGGLESDPNSASG